MEYAFGWVRSEFARTFDLFCRQGYIERLWAYLFCGKKTRTLLVRRCRVRQQTLERGTPPSHNCHLSVCAANQAKYGPEKDRAHTDVTSLSDVYQWMQVCCYWPRIGVLVLVSFKRSSCVPPFADRVKNLNDEGTVVVVPAALAPWQGVSHS